jgi:hypothetical protein
MADSNLNEIDGVPLYKPSDPYHFDFDNKPIKSLVERDKILLGLINRNAKILKDAAGELGELPIRLNQSIDSMGNLRVTSVDESMHNIANHMDGRKTITDEEVNYYEGLGYYVSNNPKFVRMIEEERNKLAQIEPQANNLKISVEHEDGDYHTFNNGVIKLKNSDTIEYELACDNSIKFNSRFPTDVAHRHYYGVEPYSDNFLDYKIQGIPKFKENSLRVFINGFRVQSCNTDCEDREFSYYPSFFGVEISWKSIFFIENNSNSSFSFSEPLSPSDKVIVDYDVELK